MVSPFRSRHSAFAQAARGRNAAIHPLEIALIAVTALHLCFLPWALGTMHEWSQGVSLGCSLLGFVLALLPRGDGGPARTPSGSIRSPLTRLQQFPVFWAGIALLAYIAVQGCNPAWRFASNADSWWLEPVDHLAWLPHGVDAPFARWNPWRAMMVFGSLWLLVCSIWIGFVRRRSYQILFTVLAVNTLLLVLLGLLQQLTDARRIFWSYLPSNPSFISSFIYRNHAGSYFNLMVALSTGMAWWHNRRSRELEKKSSPAGVFAFIAVITGLMVVFSYSRMSIFLLLVFAGFSAGILLCGILGRQVAPSRPRPESLLFAFALAGFLCLGLVSLHVEKVWQRFAEVAADPAGATRNRTQAREAAVEMWRDGWLLGWGAGCFRHEFPLYAMHHPDIYNSVGGGRNFWEHAHNDLLEFPIELGVIGLLPLASVAVYGIWQLYRRRFWRNGLALFVVLGCALLLAHAWVDFVFQNPAVLLTWAVLLVAAVRWTALDSPVINTSPG